MLTLSLFKSIVLFFHLLQLGGLSLDQFFLLFFLKIELHVLFFLMNHLLVDLRNVIGKLLVILKSLQESGWDLAFSLNEGFYCFA